MEVWRFGDLPKIGNSKNQQNRKDSKHIHTNHLKQIKNRKVFCHFKSDVEAGLQMAFLYGSLRDVGKRLCD